MNKFLNKSFEFVMNEGWIEEENKTNVVKQIWIYVGIRENNNGALGANLMVTTTNMKFVLFMCVVVIVGVYPWMKGMTVIQVMTFGWNNLFL